MEAFDRSARGRENRTLFYGVDRVLYVEGGREDKGVMESFDGLFWLRVFSVVRPELRLKVLPRGSKTSLLALARDQLNSRADTVVIAMDRDYDCLLGRLLEGPGIIYTYGYSVENDVFCPDLLKDLFVNISGYCDNHDNVQTIVSEAISEFNRDMWWGQYADVCGVMASTAVLDRKKPQKYFNSGTYGARPKLVRKSISQDVAAAAKKVDRPRVNGAPLRPEHLPMRAVGHIYECFCFKLIAYLQTIFSNTSKLTRDGVVSSAIGNFVANLAANANAELRRYYDESLAAC